MRFPLFRFFYIPSLENPLTAKIYNIKHCFKRFIQDLPTILFDSVSGNLQLGSIWLLKKTVFTVKTIIFTLEHYANFNLTETATLLC